MPEKTDQSYKGFAQLNFLGGINTFVPAHVLGDDEYVHLSNGRTRGATIYPTKKPVDITYNLKGFNLQGLYAQDRYIIAFASGGAYVYDLQTDPGNWNRIDGLQLDAYAPKIYAQLVPESFSNFERQAVGDGTDAVKLRATNSATPACLVIQDGINQPYILFGTGNARLAQDYIKWGKTNREYIPIGTFMTYDRGILYIANGRKILRSVTGRPLDFMVNIDASGNAGGDAYTVSHSVDYNNITALASVNINDGGILVSNPSISHIATPNYEKTIFAEPTFNNNFLFPTGAINNDSIAYGKNDMVLIDVTGLRSFNATKQIQTESNSDIFSAPVVDLFEGVVQDIYSCAVNFENYVLCSMESNKGSGILVFDTMSDKFVSFDQPTGVTKIKQFATTTFNNVNRIFGLDKSGKIFELYKGSLESLTLRTKAAFSGNVREFTRLEYLNLSLLNNKTDGIVYAQLYVDNKAVGSKLSRNVYKGQSLVTFNFYANETSQAGYTASVEITYTLDTELQGLSLLTSTQPVSLDIRQQSLIEDDWKRIQG